MMTTTFRSEPAMTPRKKRPFTPEEDRRLEGLRSAGLSIAEISRVMGRSRNSIESRVCRIGLTDSQEPKAWWTQAEDAILERHFATMPMENLTSILKRSASAINKRAARLRNKKTISKRDSRPHGWNMRSQDKTTYRKKTLAIAAIEQAMNQIAKSKDQHNVYIS